MATASNQSSAVLISHALVGLLAGVVVHQIAPKGVHPYLAAFVAVAVHQVLDAPAATLVADIGL